jgi:lipoate-protein ligase A
VKARVAIAVFPPADGALNFARDDALLEAARTSGETLLRVYAWDRPTVSFGRNERTEGWYTAESVQRAGVDAVRRGTGGRALLHHRELTYAIAGPVGESDTLTGTYTRISEVLVDALRALGVDAQIERDAQPSRDEGAPCFAVPSRGEIVVSGRKLVASAQWRNDRAYLQHGSILIDNDQAMLQAATVDNRPLPPVSQPMTLRELIPVLPTTADVADALAGALQARADAVVTRVAPGDIADEGFVRNRVSHYRDPAWTWRR